MTTTRHTRQASSLIRAFCRGIKQPDDDLTGNAFLQMPFLENPKLEVIRQLAERYGVTVRTIYRWERDGVNLSDPCEVGVYLSRQKTSSPAAVAAVQKLLQSELETLSK